MGAEHSSYVKSIATFALRFFGYIISVLASVKNLYAFSFSDCVKATNMQKRDFKIEQIFLQSHFYILTRYICLQFMRIVITQAV